MKTRTTRCLATSFACVLALLLAACDSDDDPQGFEAGMLGAVEVAPGEAIQIRTLMTESVETDLGLPMRRSAEIAISDYGSIHGRVVDIGDPIDSMCSAQGGKAGALEIAADPSNVVGVIGTACSVAAVQASPILSGAGLVMIAPSNTSPALTSDLAGNPNPSYFPGYYRVSVNDLHQATIVARFTYEELDLLSVATVDDGDPYTVGLTNAFRNAYEKLGGHVISQVHVYKGQTDMQDALAEIIDAYTGAEDQPAIFFPIFLKEGIPFIQQAKAHPDLGDATFITGAVFLATSFLALEESRNVYIAGPAPSDDTNVNEVTNKSYAEVLADYQAQHGTPTTPYWAHAYDAVTLLLSAVESVAEDVGGTLYIDRAMLRQALTATEDFDGLLGTLSCDDFGDCGTAGVTIYHHTDPSIIDPGGLEPVYP